jgi:hypothetical protein
MSFKDLKTKRDARLNQTNTTGPILIHENGTQIAKDGLYPQLQGSGLGIERTSTRGRGLWANKSIEPGTGWRQFPVSTNNTESLQALSCWG